MKQVNNVIDILNSLEGIEYGWMDIEKNTHLNADKGYKKNYVLSSPEEVTKYFMIYYESKKMFTHTFVVYEENEKFYWFEYSWTNNKGIHEYLSLYDLLTDVRNKFKKNNNLKFMDLDYLCVYKYKKPKYHIGLKDLYKHCESGENVII